MKYAFLFLISLLLQCRPAVAQQDCMMGTAPGSGELRYQDKAIDTLLHLRDYRAFFVGESHTDDFEPKFKYCFIRQLNRDYGVRDVFMEIGQSAAWFYNRYLETGDSSLLQGKRLVYMTGGYAGFWKQLYAYNQTLPDRLKIRIHGVDFERTDMFSMLLAAADKRQPVPAVLTDTWAHIHALAADTALDWRTDRFENERATLRASLQQYAAEFKLLYGADFNYVYQAVMNTTPSTTAVNPRNKAWRPRLLQILQENNISCFAAFFGTAHTRYGNKTSISNAVKEEPLFRDRILHIATLYRHFRTGNRFTEYSPGEAIIFEKYYNSNCRAVIVPSVQLSGAGYKSESDYVILASETLMP